MKINSWASFAVLVAVAALAGVVWVVVSPLRVPSPQAASSDIDLLKKRMATRSLPVESISFEGDKATRLVVVLQSTSTTGRLSSEDIWYSQQARREVLLSYQGGLLFESYSLIVLDPKGQTLASGEAFIYPDDINLKPISKPSLTKGVDAITNDARSALNVGELKVDTLAIRDVASDYPNQERALVIDLQAADTAQASSSLSAVFASLRPMLEPGRSDVSSAISVCQLTVRDSKGNVLVSFVRDIDFGIEQWSVVPEVKGDWQPSGPSDAASPLGTQVPYPGQGGQFEVPKQLTEPATDKTGYP